MATVTRKQRPEHPAMAPMAAPAVTAPAATAPVPAVPGAPAAPFRDRLALAVWLAAAALMGSMLLKDLIWSVIGLR